MAAPTREQIARYALQKCGVLANEEDPEAADQTRCIRAIEDILNELPIHGNVWSKLADIVSFTISANVQNTDLSTAISGFGTLFANDLTLWYVDAAGNDIPLPLVTVDTWDAIPLKTQTAPYPILAFMKPDNDTLQTWPIQTANVTVKARFNKRISDTSANTAPDLGEEWGLFFYNAVAAEIGPEYGVPPAKVEMFQKIADQKRAKLLAFNTEPGDLDSIEVEE
jgi:hypothetical protein